MCDDECRVASDECVSLLSVKCRDCTPQLFAWGKVSLIDISSNCAELSAVKIVTSYYPYGSPCACMGDKPVQICKCRSVGHMLE